ncbi:MAG: hypothetical protein RSA40_02770 [Malacoplasma sp.]
MKYQIKIMKRIVLFFLVLFVTFFLVTLSLLMVVLPSIIKSMQVLGKLDLTKLGRDIFDIFFYFLFVTGALLFFFLLVTIIYSYALNNSNINKMSDMGTRPMMQNGRNPNMMLPVMRPNMMSTPIINNRYIQQPNPAGQVISIPRPPMFKFKPSLNVAKPSLSPLPHAPQFKTRPMPRPQAIRPMPPTPIAKPSINKSGPLKQPIAPGMNKPMPQSRPMMGQAPLGSPQQRPMGKGPQQRPMGKGPQQRPMGQGPQQRPMGQGGMGPQSPSSPKPNINKPMPSNASLKPSGQRPMPSANRK